MRVLGIPVVLVALFVGVYYFAKQVRHHEPTTNLIVHDEQQAQGATAGTNFQTAATALQAWFAADGTYAGASLPPASGVALVRADTAGYCLQAGAGTAAEHENGPNGTPLAGPC
jgi:hypothetical protein